MDNITRIEKLKDDEYQALFGVQKPTFEAMLTILEEKYEQLHKQGGRPSRLSVLDKLVITLGYYREYRTMHHIGFDYDVSKSRISDAVKWVEDTLLKSGAFSLPSKRELLNPNTEIEVVIVDATEQETERPKKNRKNLTPASRNVILSKNN
jgi:predicted DNA-binding protein YlxM (UPF0122 family)